MSSSEISSQVKIGIAARLRVERERLGLTQAQLALHLGVTRFTVANYESGSRMPTADQLRALGELGVDVAFLVMGASSLRSQPGRERFRATLKAVRDHCRISKLNVPEDEIVNAAMYLFEGLRPSDSHGENRVVDELGELALRALLKL